MLRAAALALLLLLIAATPAAAGGAGPRVRPAADDGPYGDERLSNETTLTRWAHTNLLGPVRAGPARGARTVARLRWDTEDGVPEVYLVLRSRRDDADRVWLELRVPGRPNGRTGWVLEEQLSELHVVRTRLTIDRGRLTATLRRAGRRIWSARVGVGAAATPTPSGRFWIRERLSGFGGSYGPWAFGTSAYSRLSDWPGGGVVGIHGTNQPHLIPGRPSHGCVRVTNTQVRRLARLMPIGTPVRIR
jgi:hypothetical protein